MSRVVTLLTDFGLSDPYVGIVKGVLLSTAPDAVIVDLTHEVPPQEVALGAFFLKESVGFFPAGSVHLAVVDPGVGGARRALAVETEDRFFVGPDNGLLSLALRGRRVRRAVALALPRRSPSARPLSSTFHGRDLFAPAAGELARGVPLSQLGPLATGLVRLRWPAPRARGRRRIGEILVVDRFGNLITNLAAAELPRRALITVGEFRADRVRRRYDEVARGELTALVSSYGLVEIAARDASAAQILGVGRGARVVVESLL